MNSSRYPELFIAGAFLDPGFHRGDEQGRRVLSYSLEIRGTGLGGAGNGKTPDSGLRHAGMTRGHNGNLQFIERKTMEKRIFHDLAEAGNRYG